MPALLLRLLKSLGSIAGLAFLGLAAVIYLYQARMIYHPRPYAAGVEEHLPAPWKILPFQTRQGAQVAYFRAPAQPGVPRRTWAFFGGNGSQALNWLEVMPDAIPSTDAALLVEYPGYGTCAGQASPAAILESPESAANALAQTLQISRPQLDSTWCLFGHSLGAACALQFAAHHPAQRIVLFAPFTSMVEMARLQVGWPLCELCRHRFDNRARLRELASNPRPSPVLIFHGADDGMIPIRMSRSLAAELPKLVTLHEIAGADHHDVILETRAQWQAILTGANE